MDSMNPKTSLFVYNSKTVTIEDQQCISKAKRPLQSPANSKKLSS